MAFGLTSNRQPSMIQGCLYFFPKGSRIFFKSKSFILLFETVYLPCDGYVEGYGLSYVFDLFGFQWARKYFAVCRPFTVCTSGTSESQKPTSFRDRQCSVIPATWRPIYDSSIFSDSQVNFLGNIDIVLPSPQWEVTVWLSYFFYIWDETKKSVLGEQCCPDQAKYSFRFREQYQFSWSRIRFDLKISLFR